MLKNFKFFFIFHLVLIALCFTSLFAFVSNVKADSNITLEDGAEIRTTGKEGIRFIANANDLTGYTEFGFVCAKGTYSLSEMTNAFNAASWSNMEDLNTNTFTYKSGSSNGINMIRSYQSNLESGSKEIKLTIFGIEEPNYITDLSVFAYGIVNDTPVFSDINVTRNIAEVAALAKLSGDTSELVSDVVSGVKSAYKAIEVSEEKVFVYSYSSVSSLELTDLKAEFIADVNAFLGLSLTVETGYADFVAALAPSRSIKNDITNVNVYKFFNNGAMRGKWGWVAEYLFEKSGSPHVINQSREILGDGLLYEYVSVGEYNLNNLWGCEHFASALYCLFNAEYQQYTPNSLGLNLDFTNTSKYEIVNQYCKDSIAEKIASLTKVNDKINLPQSVEINGYTWSKQWLDGNVTYAANDEYTLTNEDITFKADLSATLYSIKYYNENVEYTDLAGTYTIQESVTLPTLDSHDAYVFGGWYDNPELSGDPVEAISVGTTEKQTFYAKWTFGFDTIVVDDDYASLEVGTKVTFDGVEYTVGSDAQTSIVNALAFANEGATIYVAGGTYADDFTIEQSGMKILGPNAEVDPNGVNERNPEAILTGIITLAKDIENTTIKGFKLIENAQVTVSKIDGLTSAYVNNDGFTFAYNYVDKGDSTSRAINFEESDRSYSNNVKIDYCYFAASKLENKFTYNNKEFKNAAIFINNNDYLEISNSVFKNINANAIAVYDTASAAGLRGSLALVNNKFEDVNGSAIWVNYLNTNGNSNLYLRVKGNEFANVNNDLGATIHFGQSSTTQSKRTYSEVSITKNTFKDCIRLFYGMYTRVMYNDYARTGVFQYNIIYAPEGLEYFVDAGANPVQLGYNLYFNPQGEVCVKPTEAGYADLDMYKGLDLGNFASIDDYKIAIANLS